MKKIDQETVDKIVKKMSMAGLDNHMKLAKMAVEETGRGIYEDKITKNMFATEYVYHSIKYDKTVGVISKNEEEGYSLIAEPVGVIAGVTPVTNPTSTVMFKSMIAAKTRNVIIFGFHPSPQNCSKEAAEIVRKADVSKKLELLWRPELSIIVEKYQLPAYKSLSKPALRKKLMEKLEVSQLNESISEILFERDYEKMLSEINEYRKAKNPRRRGPKKATSVKRVRRLSK